MKRFIIAAVLLVACTPQPVYPPVDADATAPPPPLIDAAPAPTPNPGDDACGHAYAHLFAVGCTPVPPKSGTWVDVCRTDRQNGLFPLKCINSVTSVAQALKCGVACQ